MAKNPDDAVPGTRVPVPGEDTMNFWMKASALVVLLVALGLLAFAQWLPALLFLPVGVGLLMWDGRTFSPSSAPDPPLRQRPGGHW